MIPEKIRTGKTYLGLELGSTRIKACLIDDTSALIAMGNHQWENRWEEGYWTYSAEDISRGIQSCYADLAQQILTQYNITLTTIGAIGISGMMHGYLVFDQRDRLLTPFRTWRNTTTEQAAAKLTQLFHFPIGQRWSIAHLYQAILNREPHTTQIAHMTTLAGYVHYLLSGNYEVGISEAAGIFPLSGQDYDPDMLQKFDQILTEGNYSRKLSQILPRIKPAGTRGAFLTERGAKFLDPKGNLKPGIPLCPPEGDAGTGMTAVNSIQPRTCSISAGTSVFSMLVLDKPLQHVYPQIDLVATPEGSPVAMVHCNNCNAELDAWVKIFGEFAAQAGFILAPSRLYDILFKSALDGEYDCGQLVACNYLSGEHITGIKQGRPMYLRMPSSHSSLANFMRAQLYAAFATLKMGMDLLTSQESIPIDVIHAHGGLFQVPKAAQQILADMLNAPVCVMDNANPGGPWGMALLASYMLNGNGEPLSQWLSQRVFHAIPTATLQPDSSCRQGIYDYIMNFQTILDFQKNWRE